MNERTSYRFWYIVAGLLVVDAVELLIVLRLRGSEDTQEAGMMMAYVAVPFVLVQIAGSAIGLARSQSHGWRLAFLIHGGLAVAVAFAAEIGLLLRLGRL